MVECCICYNENYVVKTNCNHEICVDCLSKLYKPICPICRNNLKNKLPKIILTLILKNSTKKYNNITRNTRNTNHDIIANNFFDNLGSYLVL